MASLLKLGWPYAGRMEVTLVILLFCALMTVTAGIASGPQRFQANTFLDMLGRSFDPKVAYVDLLAELTQRLNIDVNSSSNSNSLASLIGSKTPGAGSDKPSCLEAPRVKGTTVTYTSDIHAVGSRAFYQCDTGYDGMSKFIYCTQGGQWSTLANWEGCTPVDCGLITPNVHNADPTFTSTTYGSLVFYTCHAGYKLDKPNANVSCLDTGFWNKPTFVCEKATAPSLRLPSLQKAFNRNMGVQKIQQLQQLATTLLEAGPSPISKPPQPRPIIQPPPLGGKKNRSLRSLRPLTSLEPSSLPSSLSPSNANSSLPENPMMEAFIKSMQAFHAIPKMQSIEQAKSMVVPGASSFASNPMAMFAHMFPNFAPPLPPTTTTTTTTTTATPAVKSPLGFQLPTHLRSLLPNGLTSTSGMRPQDLMTLASMGLGSANAAAAPRDITQLLGGMNPMSIFGGSMGMGMGGLGLRGAAAGPGAGAAPPVEPEKIVEQREEMMMRAMMASAMKSMMGPGGSRNGTGAPARNPAMEMMTLMALQSGLNGGNNAGGGAAPAMDPLSMMMGMGGGGGGGGGGGLFGNLFGAA